MKKIDHIRGNIVSFEDGTFNETENVIAMYNWMADKIETSKMIWISVNGNDRNEKFRCSACGNEVHYIDGKARGKKREHFKAMCGYPYCPYCGARKEDENEN